MQRSVLVIDDDAEFRDLACRVLNAWGHAVVGEAGTVGEALSSVERLRPDALLVDIGLPDGDGVEEIVRESRSVRALLKHHRTVELAPS